MSTTTADDKRRVTLPQVQPGERFDVETDPEGRIILRRLQPEPRALQGEVPVVRSRLAKDGLPCLFQNVSSARIAAAIKADREERDEKIARALRRKS